MSIWLLYAGDDSCLKKNRSVAVCSSGGHFFLRKQEHSYGPTKACSILITGFLELQVTMVDRDKQENRKKLQSISTKVQP
mmetsp:Transcript_40633/g.55344  ORF Transcript_40633/g.55344 Transcript_40633/m.55344 type:complete len:80 (-) Transcript_40633:8-247(-)